MPNPWRISIDTGGTFTDCVAVDPAGRTHRVKVLSSSALRGTVIGPVSATTLAVAASWSGQPGAAAGMTFRTVSGSREARTIRGFDPVRGVLELDRPIRVEPGGLFELTADEEAPILAARLAIGVPAGQPLPPIDMRLGTTRGTNALLERRGGRVALFVTAGFADLLEIGDQQRPDLFALNIVKARPLHDAVVEVPGRLDARGLELLPLNLATVEREARQLLDSGIRAASVVLMHSWLNPAHEPAVAAMLRQAGFTHVSCSSELAPLIRILPRAQTAVVNAYLSPVIDGYVARVRAALDASAGEPDPNRRGSLHMMTSAGGLVREFRPKDSLLSGPAGGVVGAAAARPAAGFGRTIAFDMGGTSTDVSRFDGEHEYDFEHRVGAARILAPALAIESVAAGGGSVCHVEDGAVRIGPHSAGASPGPACYGAGGPLTITDCNLLLGRLDASGFQIPVSERPARERAAELLAALHRPGGKPHDQDDILEGLIDIADERMADAIARISIRQGYNPADYALVCFGGAGGQHACGVAQRLGITTVVVPPDAGLLSAAGLAAAPIERFVERQLLMPLTDAAPRLGALLDELASNARDAVAAEGVAREATVVRRRILELRLAGQDSCIPIEHAPGTGALAAAFRARFKDLYSHMPPDRPIEIVSARVVASSIAPAPAAAPSLSAEHAPAIPTPRSRRRARFRGQWRDVPVFDRASLAIGTILHGPAIIPDPHSTTVVPPGWSARLDASGALVLNASEPVRRQRRELPLAVRDELSTGRLMAVARDMGQMLQRTALSTNVKERLDFSCAILDGRGRLIVNAPHIPVHLGSLGVCVRSVMAAVRFEPGDVILTNHPGFGGSHLPDITAITPVFLHGASAPAAFVACRAHHAEIGGTRPGSMPTDARTLIEEGVVIPPTFAVRAGQARWHDLRALLTSAPFPTRALEENLADLAAQVAANHRGATALSAFAAEEGSEELVRAMDSLTAQAAHGTRATLSRLAQGAARYEARELLDDGTPLRVRISLTPDHAIFDFTGSAQTHPGNLNATPAIIRSAVVYLLRLLVQGPGLPLNEGLLEDIDLRIPRGILSPEFPADPALCPAVAGGNTETSQRIVGLLLKALNIAASSQGTMNNTLFGDGSFGYYETVCGGAGAGPGFPGADAVHTHMTNTRITDPEVLEHRYPVRLERFAIRRGSGGGLVLRLFIQFLRVSNAAWAALIRPSNTICPSTTTVGIVSDSRPAGAEALRELKPGDRIVRVGPDSVTSWNDVEAGIASTSGERVDIGLADGRVLTLKIHQAALAERIRASQAVQPFRPAILGTIVSGRPADRAGLKVMDSVISINGEPMPQWYDLVTRVRSSAGQPLTFKVLREGREVEVTVMPELETETVARGVTEKVGKIGAGPYIAAPTRPSGIGAAFGAGARATLTASTQIVRTVQGLLSARISSREVGGPILIGQMAAQSARLGLDAFLSFMALVSVNLAVLNLLPIPVLDGGQFLFLMAEGVLRRPLSLRLRERLTLVGLFLIVCLMVLAFSNDIRRLLGV